MLTRRMWGAASPNFTVATLPPSSRPGLEAHHSVGLYGASTPTEFARSLQADHLGRGNYADMFYNYLIWTDGTLIEGRPRDWRSGPSGCVTVCFAGNYQTRQLTAAQKVTFRKLRERERARGVGSEIRWHGQRASVACPGVNIISWLRAGAPAPDGKETPMSDRLLRIQDPYLRGDDVRQVQDQLAELGYEAGSSGIYGPRTEAGVRQFQDDAGIGVDGVVGPQTRGALADALEEDSSPDSPTVASELRDRVAALETAVAQLEGHTHSVGGPRG